MTSYSDLIGSVFSIGVDRLRKGASQNWKSCGYAESFHWDDIDTRLWFRFIWPLIWNPKEGDRGILLKAKNVWLHVCGWLSEIEQNRVQNVCEEEASWFCNPMAHTIHTPIQIVALLVCTIHLICAIHIHLCRSVERVIHCGVLLPISINVEWSAFYLFYKYTNVRYTKKKKKKYHFCGLNCKRIK